MSPTTREKPTICDSKLNQNRLTFDDFLPYASEINVTRYRNQDDIPESSQVLKAAKHMRKFGTYGKCYCFSLSSHKKLDRLAEVPEAVAEKDLFLNFWPVKEASAYLQSRVKIFYGFVDGYNSAPRTAYGGMWEWLHLLSGSITVTLIEPTKTNLLKVSSWTAEDRFIPEQGSAVEKYHLEPGSLLTIPAAWISIIKADDNSFAVGGEFATIRDIQMQLDQFERDIHRTEGRFHSDRDLEIRTLYCYTAFRLMEPDIRAATISTNDKAMIRLRAALLDWKKGPMRTFSGINIHNISKVLAYKSKAGSVKRKTDPVNVLSDQTSAHNHTN